MQKREIRILEKLEEFRMCEAAQKTIWGGLSVASEVMLVTQKAGGAVLGAFARNELVGFVYALLARRHGHIIHWSHMMGVLPKYRSQGIGLQLKLAHRNFALSQGIKSICWTYDPLQSRNASLNLTRLKARVEEYVVDFYGQFPSIIEQGLPTDRFIVNWLISSRAVERWIAAPGAKKVIPDAPAVSITARDSNGFLFNRKIDLGRREARLRVEIPPNADLMRTNALTLAKRWRLQTREIFLNYLSRGYHVDGFFTENSISDELRCFYILHRS